MKRILLLLCLISYISNAQEESTNIDSVIDITSAEEFLKTNKRKGNKLITFNEEKHKTILAKDLFKMSIGSKKTSDQCLIITSYKIIEKNMVPHYRTADVGLRGRITGPATSQESRVTIVDAYDKVVHAKV